MQVSLAGETVLVTGASAGFGEAIAKRLSAAGAAVILSARRQDRLEALAASLPGPAHVLPLDVRDRAAVATAVEELPPSWQSITALINNAGLALGLAPVHEADIDDWEGMIDTNVKGLLYLTRAVLPGMVARRRGYVVNIGSVAGNWPYPGGHVYCGTKAFVRQLSLAMRADLLGTPVRVTNIEPGLAETEFSLVRFHGDAERARSPYRGTEPLTGEDLADTVLWCLTRPPHVNINSIELMPTRQAFSGFSVDRDE